MQLRALFAEQVRSALASLAKVTSLAHRARARAATDEAIHAARKGIKKARATLRLVRDGLPDATYRRENRALRDAARPLNATRDAKVLVDALDQLTRRHRAMTAEAVSGFRNVLLQTQRQAQRSSRGRRTGIAESQRRLREVQRRTAGWAKDEDDWKDVRNGLKRTYSRGRRERKAATQLRSAECLHEWRKNAKYLWHQLQLLQPLRRAPIGKLAQQAHRLSDHLGDDHDLAVLREQVIAHRTRFANEKEYEAMLAAIEKSRRTCQDEAFRLGDKLYADSATEFMRRFDRNVRHSRKRKSH